MQIRLKSVFCIIAFIFVVKKGQRIYFVAYFVTLPLAFCHVGSLPDGEHKNISFFPGQLSFRSFNHLLLTFLCPALGTVEARGVMFSDCQSIPFLWTQYLKNALTEFLRIWYTWPPGLKDEATRFWWPKVKGQGHCDLTSVPFLWIRLGLGSSGSAFFCFTSFLHISEHTDSYFQDKTRLHFLTVTNCRCSQV